MTNKLKLIGIMGIVAVIVFGVISCDLFGGKYPQGTPDPDFYGRWRNTASQWREYTISANKFVHLISNGSGFTLEDLTWTAIINEESNSSVYPGGVSISGTVTAAKNIESIEGNILKVGDKLTRNVYIDVGKNQIWIQGSGTNPFIKQ